MKRRKKQITPTASFRVSAARVRGRKHEAEGESCQDAVSRLAEGSFAAIVLSDGAGSAKYGGKGASLTVSLILRLLFREFGVLQSIPHEDAKVRIIEAVISAMKRSASARNATVKDYACTLLFAATDGKSLLIGQLGDGRIGLLSKDNVLWRSPFNPTKGEFFNETSFVTSQNAIQDMQLECLPMGNVSSCVLMSDGAEEALFNRSERVFAPALNSLNNWVAKFPKEEVEAAFKKNLKEMVRQKTFDDVSLAFLTELSK